MSGKITAITAREIMALRGNVCLEVKVTTDSGFTGRSTPEVGVSTGTYEAVMVLDGGERYGGMGVRKAARNVVEEIAPRLIGMEVSRQREIDDAMCELDGTPNKSRLGANAIVGVSLAVVKAAAMDAGLPLYQYVGGPDATTMAIPIVGVGTAGRYRDPGKTRWFKPSYEFVPYGATTFAEAVEMAWVARKALERIMSARFGFRIVGYRGLNDLGSLLKHDSELLDAMTEAIVSSGYEGRMGLYFDAASDCYYEADIDRYVGIFTEGEKDTEQMIRQYQDFIEAYPIVSIEDVLREDDLEGMALATRELGIEIVGDDFFTTNIERLKRAAEVGAANSMVLKITQVGTVTEALDACQYALRHGYNIHPCGSRGDSDSIGDFAVALGAGQLRTTDYNRMLDIEEELGAAAIWPGKAVFKGDKQNR